MHAWAEVCHLLQSSKSPLTGFLSSIGWRIAGFLQILPAIIYSAILRNNYILLLSDLCACVHVKKKWRRKGSHSSVSGSNRLVSLQTWKKAMGWCIAQWKMLLFCAKTIVKESRKFELARLKKKKKKKKKKEKHFWPSGDQKRLQRLVVTRANTNDSGRFVPRRSRGWLDSSIVESIATCTSRPRTRYIIYMCARAQCMQCSIYV